MKFLLYFFLLLVVCAIGLFAWTRYQVSEIEAMTRPIGAITNIGGRAIHFLDIPHKGEEGLPTILFVHGASGNLRDQLGAYRQKLEGKGRLIFVDRPGHGYSERGEGAVSDPAAQAAVYKQLFDHLQIDKAVLVGHSMGSASVAAFAVHYPERVKGLVFVAPATHPWPGGVTWYYEWASVPVFGWLFTELLTLPAGQMRMAAAVDSVFSPNSAPDDYAETTGANLVLRPANFRANARDVTALNARVAELSPRYKEISAPTSIITGDQDDVVLAEIHSIGLERDIANSRLIVEKGVGHKPDYVSTDVVIGEIRRVSGN